MASKMGGGLASVLGNNNFVGACLGVFGIAAFCGVAMSTPETTHAMDKDNVNDKNPAINQTAGGKLKRRASWEAKFEGHESPVGPLPDVQHRERTPMHTW
eukprot:3654774-Prymnesium_polylepis.1